MPLYMDVHEKVDGLTAEALAEGHKKDLETQHKHGVNYLRYWYNEAEGKVFCLFEAPSREAERRCTGRRTAHGRPDHRGRGGDVGISVPGAGLSERSCTAVGSPKALILGTWAVIPRRA
ncbi:MAG: DUF4242 domain-containing protein [Chloroflexia bacterium]